MIYIGFVIAAVVIFVLAMIVGWALSALAAEHEKEEAQSLGRLIQIVAFVLVGIFVVGLTLGSSVKTVKAGHTGLVYTFADITGQRSPGLNLIMPWQGFKEINTQVQRIRPETICEDVNAQGQVVAQLPDCLATFSSETQNVFIIPSINVKLQRGGDLEFLYSDVGPDWVDEILRPRLHQAFKDVTRLYKSVDIAPAREEIREKVVERLNEEMESVPEAGAIFIVDVLIDNISFSQSFETKILQKQEATQEAERQAALVVAAENQAEQAVKRAEGEARANTVLAESLRVNGNFILQFRAIEALADDVKIIMLPTDSGIIPILGESFLTGTGPASPPPRAP